MDAIKANIITEQQNIFGVYSTKSVIVETSETHLVNLKNVKLFQKNDKKMKNNSIIQKSHSKQKKKKIYSNNNSENIPQDKKFNQMKDYMLFETFNESFFNPESNKNNAGDFFLDFNNKNQLSKFKSKNKNAFGNDVLLIIFYDLIFDRYIFHEFIASIINDEKAQYIKHILNNLLLDLNENLGKHHIKNKNKSVTDKISLKVEPLTNKKLNEFNLEKSSMSNSSIIDIITSFNPMKTKLISNINTTNESVKLKKVKQESILFTLPYANFIKSNKCYKILLIKPYDDFIKSFYSRNDRRITSISKKVDVNIKLFGPYSTASEGTQKKMYHCLISSLLISNLDKCIKMIIITFPNSTPKVLDVVEN